VPSLKVLSLFRELYACLGHGSRDDATSSKAPAAWRQEQNGLVRNVGRLFNPQPGSVFRNVDDQARAERQFVVGFAQKGNYVGGSSGQFCAAASSLSEMVDTTWCKPSCVRTGPPNATRVRRRRAPDNFGISIDGLRLSD